MGAEARVLPQQMAFRAEQEAALISARTKAVLADKRPASQPRKEKLGGKRRTKLTESGQSASIGFLLSVHDSMRQACSTLIRDLQGTGVTSLWGIAAELNKREIPTAGGAKWRAAQVGRVLGRFKA